MALPVLPSPSNFLAVALVINRSRTGPRFVFHYPPHVLVSESSGGTSDGDGVDADGDEDDDILLGRSSQLPGFETGGASSSPELEQWNHDDHLVTESGSQIVPWEYFAGFPTKDLENLLTPARAYHKRLFQVSLDPLCCVSYPIYVPENEVWRKKKKKKQQQEAKAPAKDEDDDIGPNDTDGLAKNDDSKGSDADQSDAARDETIPPAAKIPDEAEDKRSSMNMFNLVFILNPKKHEVDDLVDVMFAHIIKKINKAYKYCQQRSDFVWKESKRILALKDKAREDKRKMSSLWEEILQTSTLAASMQDIYDAVSRNKIVALQLDTLGGLVTHSVQIPVPSHLPDLPQDGARDQQGLWLTTVNSFMADDAMEEPDFMDRNFALLLTADEKRVIAELQGDPDETTLAMVEFVRHCKPTLSFYQVGQQSSNALTPAQVRKFAQHFIFWRRAIAIPPLHVRDMYIVSPNCDLRKLPQAAAQWARHFPLSPPLPNFLAELAVAPRPYKLHCPSKAHRPIYMAMLTWLMRGGWVTQLCTFAYVVVWPEIIYEVEYMEEAEEIAKAKHAQGRGRESRSMESNDTTISSGSSLTNPGVIGAGVSGGIAALGDAAVAGFGSSFLPLPDDSSDTMNSSIATVRDLSLSHNSQSINTAAVATAIQPLQTPAAADLSFESERPLSPSSPNQTRGPVITADTQDATTPSQQQQQQQQQQVPPTAKQAAEIARLERIAEKAAHDLVERASAHSRKAPPLRTAHPSVNAARHLASMSPHIILDAKKATSKESLYLSAIERRLHDRTTGTTTTTTTRPGNRRPSILDIAGGPRFDPSAAADAISGDKGIRVSSGNVHGTGGSVRAGGGIASGANARNGGKEWDERVAKAWLLFWKYFNGRSALERIALQEEMKRKDAWNLLTAMSEYLLCVRHW
ncbi:nitrogen permease regulator of amino acid transport activity 3-domain-containing protein [Bombardia bombarda]|uniref:Nitrogen permease regulator 3 n=1 Tax=Bombardia bombarda TaxID=252184 RepID=A0AA39WAZ2_9PEZI|nr:nitrogen permease regulator of amino acid transport activity 3-domain-containing protein [Bombardia bombarda]